MDKLKKQYNKYIFENKQNYCIEIVSANTEEDIFLDKIAGKLFNDIDILCLKNIGMPQMKFVELCKKIKTLCAEFNAIFLVNSRADIAFLCEADGIHLEINDIDIHSAREILGKNVIVGVSVDDAQTINNIENEADYILIEKNIESSLLPKLNIPCFINSNPIKRVF